MLNTFPLQTVNCLKLRMLRTLYHRDLVPLVFALFSFCLGYTQFSAAIFCADLILSTSYNSVFHLIQLPGHSWLDLETNYQLVLLCTTPHFV